MLTVVAMRRRVLAMLGVVGLLQTGCAGNEAVSPTEHASSPSASFTQQPSALLPNVMPKPAPGDLAAFPTPDDHAPYKENLERLVRRDTAWLAGYAGQITAQCPDKTPRSGMTLTCTSAISGVTVTWDVTVKSVSASSVKYDLAPRNGLIVRDGVVSAFYDEYTGAKTVRCNDIPEAVLVPLSEETKYACQAQYEGEGFSAPQRVTATTKGPDLSD